MDEYSSRLTVFYEEPFWVGVFERMEGDRLSVSKVTFGAEPKGYEVLDKAMGGTGYSQSQTPQNTIHPQDRGSG